MRLHSFTFLPCNNNWYALTFGVPSDLEVQILEINNRHDFRVMGMSCFMQFSSPRVMQLCSDTALLHSSEK